MHHLQQEIICNSLGAAFALRQQEVSYSAYQVWAERTRIRFFEKVYNNVNIILRKDSMKRKYLVIIVLLITIIALSLGYYLIFAENPLSSLKQGYRLDVNLQYCNYSYGLEGNGFGAVAEITNSGRTIVPPAAVWLIYDNKICDKKDINKAYIENAVVFNNQDGKWFRCNVELPPGRRETEAMNKSFKFVYTAKNQDPLKEGVTIFSSTTKDLCFTVVQ